MQESRIVGVEKGESQVRQGIGVSKAMTKSTFSGIESLATGELDFLEIIFAGVILDYQPFGPRLRPSSR